MQTTINQRIESLIFSLEKGKQKRFADKIGVTPSVINNIIAGRMNEPSFKVLQKVADAYKSLNLEWLLSGEGTMLKGESQPKIISNELAKQDGLPDGAIPLYDIDINASNVQRLIDYNDDVPLVGWIHLEDMNSKGLVGVRAKGDSMATFINGGDVMLIRRIEDMNIVNLGYPHVVITSEQSMVKYVRAGETKEEWIMRSHNNEKHQDFPIPKKAVKHLFVVVKVLKDITY